MPLRCHLHRLLPPLLLCLFSMHSLADTPAPLSDKDLQAFQLLVLGPKNNEVKGCLDASFGLLEGLLAVSGSPDSKVEELLTRGDMSPAQREMRSQQAALWKTHHSPAKLANFQYGWCLKDKAMPAINLGQSGESCFNAAMVPAYAVLLKTGLKASREDAQTKVISTWGQQVPETFLKQVVDDVYTAEDTEKAYHVTRRVFVSCVTTQRPR